MSDDIREELAKLERQKWCRKTRDDELERWVVARDVFKGMAEKGQAFHAVETFLGFEISVRPWLRDGEYFLLPKPIVEAIDDIANWCSGELARELLMRVDDYPGDPL